MADMKTLSDGKNTFNVFDSNALHTTDGKLTKDLSLGNHRIVEVADPVADTDVANKKYMDTKGAETLTASKRYTDEKNTETLTAAKQYTDETVVGGGSSSLAYEPLTFKYVDGAMTRAPSPNSFTFRRGLAGKIGNIVFIEVIAEIDGGSNSQPVKVGTYSGDVLSLIQNKVDSNLDGIILHDPVYSSDFKGTVLKLCPNGDVCVGNSEFNGGIRHLTGFFIIE